MPAKIKLFIDEACTKEIYRSGTGEFLYIYYAEDAKGNITPYINGNTGGTVPFCLYLKNVGTRAALNTRLIKIEKSEEEVDLIKEYQVFAGDIAVDEVKKAEFTCNVEPWTRGMLNDTMFVIDYYSLPDTTTDANQHSEYSYVAKETNIQEIESIFPKLIEDTSEEDEE